MEEGMKWMTKESAVRRIMHWIAASMSTDSGQITWRVKVKSRANTVLERLLDRELPEWMEFAAEIALTVVIAFFLYVFV